MYQQDDSPHLLIVSGALLLWQWQELKTFQVLLLHVCSWVSSKQVTASIKLEDTMAAY